MARFNLSVVNNSPNRKTAEVQFISNRGIGKPVWTKRITVQGFNNPNRRPSHVTKSRRSVDFNETGVFKVVVDTGSGRDTAYIRKPSRRFPHGIEITSYINFDESVELNASLIA